MRMPVLCPQKVVEFIAGEIEADAWERLTSQVEGSSDARAAGSRRSARQDGSMAAAAAAGGEGDLQAFIADLTRVADDRKVIARIT